MKYIFVLFFVLFFSNEYILGKYLINQPIVESIAESGNSNIYLMPINSSPIDNLFVQTKSKLGKFVPLTGNLDQMKYFNAALKQVSTKKIRIAHYGDSLVQGDIITEYIREKFQDRFGGRGAGFLNIVSNDIRMRNTTIHSYSNDWEYVSIITRNPNQLTLGISGAVSIPKLNSWVKYETTSHLKSTRHFEKVDFYYSNADESSTFQYTINGKTVGKINLVKGEDVKIATIPVGSNGTSIELKFIGGKAPYVYGVSLALEY